MDIFEQTNNQQPNIMSLHSSSEPNCIIAGSGQSGTLLTNDRAVSNLLKAAHLPKLNMDSSQTRTSDAQSHPTNPPALRSTPIGAASSPCSGRLKGCRCGPSIAAESLHRSPTGLPHQCWVNSDHQSQTSKAHATSTLTLSIIR